LKKKTQGREKREIEHVHEEKQFNGKSLISILKEIVYGCCML
jgi:hypothetical protein